MNKKTLDKLLTHGVKHGASDLHFLVGDTPSYRINGRLRPVKCDPLTPQDTLKIATHLLGDLAEKTDLGEVQEFDCSYSIPGIARFRVNLFRQRGSVSAILRVIPRSIPNVDDLGLPARVRELADEERGLVLVTGATGSGKTSTLAAMLDHINRTRPAHILTIEDPIEFLHKNRMASVSQREVGSDTSSFTQALRAALRQDPDVILVGEMRDPETIDIALKAAETGHMVYSTVHTTDVAENRRPPHRHLPVRRTTIGSAAPRRQPEGRHQPTPPASHRRQRAGRRLRSHGGDQVDAGTHQGRESHG